MKSRKVMILISLPLLIAVALFLKGCGVDTDYAKELGCPAGSAIATGTDIINAVGDKGDMTGLVTHATWSGSIYQVSTSPNTYTIPFTKTIRFYVTDQFASEKNNICVELTAPGIFWDRNYTTVKGIRRYVTETNESGVVDVYYSTQAVMASAASPSAGSTGTSASYTDQILAQSGAALAAEFELTTTVEGCPDPAIDPTPCP
jgi:hypothetical protein